MTLADHANTVREALTYYAVGVGIGLDMIDKGHAALDALQAQAETAEELRQERDRLKRRLNALTDADVLRW